MKVHELLNSSNRWTKEWIAKDVNDYSVPEDSPNAVCWCLIGAVYRCYPHKEKRDVFKKIITKIGTTMIGEWNDSHSYEEVITLVRELDI